MLRVYSAKKILDTMERECLHCEETGRQGCKLSCLWYCIIIVGGVQNHCSWSYYVFICCQAITQDLMKICFLGSFVILWDIFARRRSFVIFVSHFPFARRKQKGALDAAKYVYISAGFNIFVPQCFCSTELKQTAWILISKYETLYVVV